MINPMTKSHQMHRTPSAPFVPTPHDMDRWISWLLRGGVLISLVFLVMGMTLTFIHHPDYLSLATSTQHLKNPVAETVPHQISDIFTMIAQGRGQGIMALGLLVLIATPIMRVALSVVTFWLEKDRAFVWITAGVLSLLLLSLALGKAG